jgi:FAD linked oxidases, C-terminal domain
VAGDGGERVLVDLSTTWYLYRHVDAHVNLFKDPAKPQHGTALLAEFARHAVELGGTVAAEHGLGSAKLACCRCNMRPNTWSHARREAPFRSRRHPRPRNHGGEGV